MLINQQSGNGNGENLFSMRRCKRKARTTLTCFGIMHRIKKEVRGENRVILKREYIDTAPPALAMA